MMLMNSYGADEKAKYTMEMLTLLQDAYDKKGKIDILDWLIIAQHFGKSQEEEVAFQAYYIAHLKDH